MDVIDYKHWTQSSKGKGSVVALEVYSLKPSAMQNARAWRERTDNSVRTFRRDIRCDGLCLGLHVVVVRRKP